MSVNAVSSYSYPLWNGVKTENNNSNYENPFVKMPVKETKVPAKAPKAQAKTPEKEQSILETVLGILGNVLSLGLTSCTKIDVEAYAEANANAKVVVSTPEEKEAPLDSLKHWGEFIDIIDDGGDDNIVMSEFGGIGQWDYSTYHQLTLDLEKSNKEKSYYTHRIVNGQVEKRELTASLVKAGEITVVKKDGTETNQVSGVLFEENGKKYFAHSNGKDTVFVYPQATDGKNQGKFVQKAILTKGYLDSEYEGKNFLIMDRLGEGTEEHFVQCETELKDVTK